MKMQLLNEDSQTRNTPIKPNSSPFTKHKRLCFFLVALIMTQAAPAGWWSKVPFIGPTIDKGISGATSFVTDGVTTLANKVNTVTGEVGIDVTLVSDKLNTLISHTLNPPNPEDFADAQYQMLDTFPGVVSSFMSIPNNVESIQTLADSIRNKDTDSARAAIYFIIRKMSSGPQQAVLQDALNHLKNHADAKSLLLEISVAEHHSMSIGVALDIDAYDDIVNDTLSSAPETVLSFYIGHALSFGGGSGVSMAMGYSKNVPLEVGGQSFDLSVPVHSFNIVMGFEPWDRYNPFTIVTEDFLSRHHATFVTPYGAPDVSSSASKVFMKVCKNNNVQLPDGTCNTGAVKVNLLNLTENMRSSAGGVVFAWSSAGEIANMFCVSVNESAEPAHHTWGDNYFCSSEDIGIRWYTSSDLPGDMHCIPVHESADPHTWNDNYICLPFDSPFTFSFHEVGNPGGSTVRWIEPADPHTWYDNYMKVEVEDSDDSNLVHDDFDALFYLEKNPDLVPGFGTNFDALYDHWLQWGRHEGRQAVPDFHLLYYIDTYQDLRDGFGYDYVQAYNHWRNYGIQEGRRASEDFDPNFYLEYHPDLKAYFGVDIVGAYYHFKHNWRSFNKGQTDADGYRLFRP